MQLSKISQVIFLLIALHMQLVNHMSRPFSQMLITVGVSLDLLRLGGLQFLL